MALWSMTPVAISYHVICATSWSLVLGTGNVSKKGVRTQLGKWLKFQLQTAFFVYFDAFYHNKGV
jgi:hypothetical protein